MYAVHEEIAQIPVVTCEEIEAVIDRGDIPVVWQPIVSLTTRDVLGYEALARFSATDDLSPVAWFKAATKYGLRQDLEILAVRSAVRQLGRLPETVFVSLNVSPGTVASPELEEALDGVAASRVVLEISEDAVVDASEPVQAAIDRFRSSGVRVALDDTGSGLVSLRQLLGVHADIIKIDTDVTRGIDFDVTKQAIAYALKSLAERSGAMSLAEGVETEEEADLLTSLGIGAAQGYLFGKPSAIA